MNFKRLNNIVGWVIFAIAAILYLMTMERSFSFWDAGEYIVSSSKLGVTHAPGAAFFQILGAVWSILALGDGGSYAIVINSLSAICSAFTILFLFWIITHFVRRLLNNNPSQKLSKNQVLIVLLCGIVGSLCFMFSDSFWFSAVEGEVYAMASMFSAIMVWMICKWENEANEPRADKWLLLISLLIGLATGVHLMAILVVPAICYIYYFKKFEFSLKSFLIANAITLAIFVFIFKIIFSTTMSLFGKFDIFFVNELGLPFNSGSLAAAIILAFIFFFLIRFTIKKGYVHANSAVLCILFMLIGFMSWLVIPIRANANPHMNLNDPDDAAGVLDYYNRVQYGDWPIFNGPLYTAHLDSNGILKDENGNYKTKDHGPIYKKNEKRGIYEVVGRRQTYVYNPEHIGLFARMFNPLAIEGYKGLMGEPETYTSFNPATGQNETHYVKPSFADNVRFFLSYQVGYMYLRYLGWNFIGRQNDYEGNTEVTKGNVITGIPFIDNYTLGDQSLLPDDYKNESRNVYFMLPFILGICGIWFHFSKDWKRAFALLSLFLLGGVGIILYTNVRPFEPRERDYAVVTSFFVFSIWIGFGVLAVYQFVRDLSSEKLATGVSIALIAIPLLMGFQNFDDHDRSERKAAYDLAYNYLVNLDPNSILIVYGDNDTYPLWAMQETEQFRDDVKVVNYTLLSSPWNISQAKRKTYNAEAIPSQMVETDYRMGVNEGILVMDSELLGQILAYANEMNPTLAKNLKPLESYVENGMTAKEAMNWILDKNNPTKIALLNELKQIYYSGLDNVLPTNKIIVPVDKQAVLKNGIVDSSRADEIVPNVIFSINSNQIKYKSELIFLDMLANYDWSRGLYFSSGGLYEDANIFYLNNYLQFEGFVYKFVPIVTKEGEMGETGGMNPNKMYDYITNYKWANFNNPDAYFDPTSKNNILTYRNSVIRTIEALLRDGQKDKAKNLLLLLDDKIPYAKFPDGFSLYSLPPLYRQVGLEDKANEIQSFLKDRKNQLSAYFNSLDENQRASVMRDIRRMESEEQYAAGSMIDYYLTVEKDTLKAFETFKAYYNPIKERIRQTINKASATGIGGLSIEDENRLMQDLTLQRTILPMAVGIDSTYADRESREIINMLETLNPNR